MSRICFSVLPLILSLIASAVAAMDFKGRVTAVDSDMRTISVKADDQEQTFDISKDVKVFRLYGSGKRAGFNEAPRGLKEVTVGAPVTVSIDFIDGKDQAVRIKVESSGGMLLAVDNPPPPKLLPPPEEKKTTTDIQGTISALDGRKRLMTLTVDDKPRKLIVSKDCTVFVAVKAAKKRPRYDVSPGGLADLTVGLDVTVTVDSKSGRNLVTMVKINTPAKK